jgi:hypothetical protein
MNEINTLREMRTAPPPAELEAMRLAARDRFVAGTGPKRARQQWRLPVLAGGLTAAAAATAAAALVLTSAPGAVPGQHATAGHTRTVVTAAWTVREDAGGTVTIYLHQYANPAALQQTLRADGVNAIVRQIPWVLHTTNFGRAVAVPACVDAAADKAPLAVQHAVLTIRGVTLPALFIIHPDAMPPGSALLLAFLANAPLPMGNRSIFAMKPWVLNNDTVPACVPVPTKPAPTPAPKAAPAPTPAPKAP